MVADRRGKTLKHGNTSRRVSGSYDESYAGKLTSEWVGKGRVGLATHSPAFLSQVPRVLLWQKQLPIAEGRHQQGY
jgi:hypothetical protein